MARFVDRSFVDHRRTSARLSFLFFFFLPTLTRQKSCSKDDDDDDDDTAVEEMVSFLARKEQDSLLYGKRENGDSGT